MKDIRIIVSSKHLANQLNELNTDEIYRVDVDGDNCIAISTATQSVDIHCVVDSIDKRLYPEGRRWDWLRKLVNQVDEQPIILEISEVSLKVYFVY